MTILEAINQVNFEWMDYLRITGDPPGQKIFDRTRKSRDIFPESTEILWELARRYEIVEKMPVTAAVLYRKIIELPLLKAPLPNRHKWSFQNLSLHNSHATPASSPSDICPKLPMDL